MKTIIAFNSIFNLTFFLNLGAVILAVVGLGFAISYKRSQEGKVSLFLLLATALATAYYFCQWFANSFVSYCISYYSAAHQTFQMPTWFNGALILFFITLNYAFIITLMLTALFAVKQQKAEELDRTLLRSALTLDRNLSLTAKTIPLYSKSSAPVTFHKVGDNLTSIVPTDGLLKNGSVPAARQVTVVLTNKLKP